MTDLSCWKCMQRTVTRLGDECGSCRYKSWKKAEHQLFHTSRQRGKVTTEEVHESYRAPAWMADALQGGGRIVETEWGWEIRTPQGRRIMQATPPTV